MYFNDIHILIYLVVGLFGCVVGQVIGLVNERLMNHEKIIENGSLKRFKKEFIPHYGLMTVMFILYDILFFFKKKVLHLEIFLISCRFENII